MADVKSDMSRFLFRMRTFTLNNVDKRRIYFTEKNKKRNFELEN